MLDQQSMKGKIHLHLKVVVWQGAEEVLCLHARAAAKVDLHATICQ